MVFKLTCFSFATIATVMCFFILRGYSNISEMRMNITNLEKRRNELELTKNSIFSELEEAKGSIKISQEAMYKLSMDYPSKDQVVYLSIGKTDNKDSDLVGQKDGAKEK